MALLKDKYIYHSRKKKRKKLRFFLLIIIVSAFITGSTFLIRSFLIKKKDTNSNHEITIQELWSSKNYDEIIASCEVALKNNPLDPHVLAYLGFSCFYKADSEIENKITYYEKTILYLRKALVNDEVPFQKEIYFILGISYYYKEKYFFDLSIKYLEKAISLGINRPEALIRLGLAYGKLGNTKKELDCLLEASSQTSSSWLWLLLGKAYHKENQFDQAEEYFIRYINEADDSLTVQEARFRLGEIYFYNQDYNKAEGQYREILKLDEKSAEAHFNLGEIYYKLKNNIKARAEWREALRIDPSHYGARLRYYK